MKLPSALFEFGVKNGEVFLILSTSPFWWYLSVCSIVQEKERVCVEFTHEELFNFYEKVFIL